MGENKVTKGKKMLPKVAKISYTPQTLAAAIAKNIRAAKELRDMPLDWDQKNWGKINIKDLVSEDKQIKVEANKIHGVSDILEIQSGNVDDVFYGERAFVGVSCGTTGCIAGWATSLSGDIPVVDQSDFDYAVSSYQEGYYNEHDNYIISNVYSPDLGVVVEISARGRVLLGMSEVESDWAFNQDRTEAEVLDYLDVLATGGKVSQCDSYRHRNHKDQWTGRWTEDRSEEGCRFCDEARNIKLWIEAKVKWV